jgi:serralysin
VADAAGNQSAAGTPYTATFDTEAPTLAVTLSTAFLRKGSTSTVTFTFSEVPINFSLANVSATCGSFSALTTVPNSDGKIFTATLTPPANTSGPNSVLSVDTNWSDAAGNPPAASATATYTVSTGRRNVVITGTDSENTLTGSNRSETILGLGGNDILSGKRGNDTINGGAGNDSISGGAGKDILTGGYGIDTFDYSNISDSRLPRSFDIITDFVIGTDSINGPNSVSATQLAELGTVSALTYAAIRAVLTTSDFVANGAATFTYVTGLNTRTFLALNDASSGFSARSDGLVEITGYTGSLNDLAVI